MNPRLDHTGINGQYPVRTSPGICLRMALAAMILIFSFLTAACENDTGTSSSESSYRQLNTGYVIEPLGASLHQLMPTTGKSGTLTMDTDRSKISDCTLSDWDRGWHADVNGSVLNRIFSMDNDKSVVHAIRVLDGLIFRLNTYSMQWNTSGVQTIADKAETITINNDIRQVWVPFYGGNVAVNHLITIRNNRTSMVQHLAFSDDADSGEDRVVIFTADEKGDHSVFYMWRDWRMGDISVWFADTASGINFKWTANTVEQWFSVTYISEGCNGDLSIMGGGEAGPTELQLAFIAGQFQSSTAIDEWYVQFDSRYLKDSTTYTAIPVDNVGQPADGSGMLKFIATSENHPRGATDWCPGWLNAADRPLNPSAIVWEQ
ncbi:MAG: hypothetical protein HKM93_20640 [Desulfobacteraceae bacterium]|nr:hypothetical protein [Desulfobacteraceae bacterium]